MDHPHIPHFAATILIVEDDEVLANMLSNALLQHGATVQLAHDGAEALQLIPERATDAKTIDLILLDIDMPKLSGITVLEQMRTRGLHIPVIMLTNLSAPNHIADAAELGVTEYLVKADWELDDIVRKVHTRLFPETDHS